MRYIQFAVYKSCTCIAAFLFDKSGKKRPQTTEYNSKSVESWSLEGVPDKLSYLKTFSWYQFRKTHILVVVFTTSFKTFIICFKNLKKEISKYFLYQ